MISAVANEFHYLDHILPIWLKLPEHLRSQLYVHTSLIDYCRRMGVEPTKGKIPRHGGPVMVSSMSDYRSAKDRPIIFVEHGSGQSYLGDAARNSAYSGGEGRERIILFICPSHRVAERNLARYPDKATAVVGSPRLDRYHPSIPKPRSDPPTIAFTWHADIRLVPESTNAFRTFHSTMLMTRDAGYKVLGHGHPRIYRRLVPLYNKWKVEHTGDPDRVFREADCLVADNSSLGFEFATLGRPLVWLSPPTYRRDVIQWPRFWDALILGAHCENPNEILYALHDALGPVSPRLQQARDQFLDTVYSAPRDGKAADRAVEAIVKVVGA